MKNLKVNMTALALAGTLLLTGTGFDGQVHAVNDSKVVAQTQTKNDQITVSEGVNIYVDNVPYQPKDAAGNNVEPFIYNGTTYLPARAIANIYGANISWDGKTNSVYIGKTGEKKLNVTPKMEDTPLRNATIPVSTDVKIYVEGENGTYQRFIPMDASGKEVPVIISNGTTYLPARAISNIYGTNIAWDGKNSRVYIGEQFVVENPEQYNEYQLDALQRFDSTDREFVILDEIFNTFERNYNYLLDITRQYRVLANMTDGDLKSKYEQLWEKSYELCNLCGKYKARITRYSNVDKVLENLKGRIDEANDEYLSYIKTSQFGLNGILIDYGITYLQVCDEKLLEQIAYLEDECRKLGITADWTYCNQFPGIDEYRKSKIKVLTD